MPELLAPPSIDVKVPFIETTSGERTIPMFTQLFREECRLPEALQQAYARNEGAEELRIVSAGCSIGAETDTLLALHSKIGSGGRLTVAGFDNNRLAIYRAHYGTYFLPRLTHSDEELNELRGTLEYYGFGFDFDTVHTTRSPRSGMVHGLLGYHTIDAAPLRLGNTVTFTQGDFIEDVPKTGETDLLVANNMLYHHPHERATKIVRNLAEMLADNAVLSIGDIRNVHPKSKYMGINRRDHTMTYYDWVGRTAELLQAEVNLEPVVWGAHELPVMFARS